MKNATINDRTLAEALNHAENKRAELPHIVQVVPSDWDIVILANEIKRLNFVLDNLIDSVGNILDNK